MKKQTCGPGNHTCATPVCIRCGVNANEEQRMLIEKLRATEKVVTAWAENASGPGWANRVVWALMRDAQGNLRLESLQQEEQAEPICSLFDVSAAAAEAMRSAVEWALAKRRKP